MRLEGVRVIVAPWAFRLFWPRFSGMTLGRRTILLRSADYSDDLLTHELCHVWQVQQHGWLRTTWAYLRNEYRRNPYEIQARLAVIETGAGP